MYKYANTSMNLQIGKYKYTDAEGKSVRVNIGASHLWSICKYKYECTKTQTQLEMHKHKNTKMNFKIGKYKYTNAKGESGSPVNIGTSHLWSICKYKYKCTKAKYK